MIEINFLYLFEIGSISKTFKKLSTSKKLRVIKIMNFKT